jgi:hypothetical protein
VRKTNRAPPVAVLDTMVRREDHLLVAPPPPLVYMMKRKGLDLREKKQICF